MKNGLYANRSTTLLHLDQHNCLETTTQTKKHNNHQFCCIIYEGRVIKSLKGIISFIILLYHNNKILDYHQSIHQSIEK